MCVCSKIEEERLCERGGRDRGDRQVRGKPNRPRASRGLQAQGGSRSFVGARLGGLERGRSTWQAGMGACAEGGLGRGMAIQCLVRGLKG